MTTAMHGIEYTPHPSPNYFEAAIHVQESLPRKVAASSVQQLTLHAARSTPHGDRTITGDDIK